MSSKISKEDLKAPDTFHSVSDLAFQWIERHAKPIAGVIALALLFGIGWIVYGYLETRAERLAAEALYGPQGELQKAQAKAQDDRTKAKDKLPSAVDYKTAYAPSVLKIKDALKQHASTKVALVGAMELSSTLVGEKQYGEALEVLNIPTARPASGDVLEGLFLMHRALAELENQKFDEAAKSYQRLVDSMGLKSFHAEALLKLGLTLEQKGDATKARDAYDRVTREFPDSEASTTARQYLRLLDLKAKPG